MCVRACMCMFDIMLKSTLKEFLKVLKGLKESLTERLRRSAIPHMQRLLNKHARDKKEVCKQISSFKPVNNGLLCKSVSLRH